METQHQEDGEAYFLRRYWNSGRRSQLAVRNNYFPLNPRHHRRHTDSKGPSAQRFFASTDSGGVSAPRPQNQTPYLDPTQKGTNNATAYQPPYRSRVPDRQRSNQCNLCGIEGHFERVCDLRSILDRIKDHEHRLLERRQRSLRGQVNHLEESPEAFEQDPDDLLANQVVNACLIELNMVESPQENTAWYLDSGATHHVSGDSNLLDLPNQRSSS